MYEDHCPVNFFFFFFHFKLFDWLLVVLKFICIFRSRATSTCTIHVHKNYTEMRDNGIKTSYYHCKVLRVENRWKKIIQK